MFKNISVYLLAELLNKLFPMLLTPILTAYLTKQDYGLVSYFQVLFQFGIMLFSFGMLSPLLVVYHKKGEIEFQKQFTSAFIVISILFLLSITLVYFYSLFFTISLSLPHFFLISLSSFFTSFIYMLATYFQAKLKVGAVALLNISTSLLTFISVLIFVCYFNFGLNGWLFSILFGVCGVFLYCIYFCIKKLFIFRSVNLKEILKMLNSGFPLFIHSIANWGRSSIDKFYLMFLVSASALATYNAQFIVASLLSIFFMTLNKALSPYLYKSLHARQLTKKDSIRLIGYLCLFCILCFIVFIICYPLLFKILVSSKYQYEFSLILLFSFAGLWQGLYFVMCNYLFYMEKNKIISIASMISSLSLLIFAPIFYHYFNILGIALSLCISWFVLLCITSINLYFLFPKIPFRKKEPIFEKNT